MPAVYTELLFDEVMLGLVVYESAVVPDGYVWVVRDIRAVAPTTADDPYGLGLQVAKASTTSLIASFWPPFTYPGLEYSWEGRQVLEAGDNLLVQCSGNGWTCEITGFVLTAST
jgi:hypothetical protein